MGALGIRQFKLFAGKLSNIGDRFRSQNADDMYNDDQIEIF